MVAASSVAATLALALPASATTVKVLPGQNLSQIAAHYGTTVSALASANGIANPNIVVSGSNLTIPSAGASTTTSTPPATSSAVIQSGDTLTAIAAHYGTTVAAIVSANGIADPNNVAIGTHLTIPSAGASTSTSTPPATSSAVIQAGDTLTAIAAHYGTTVAAIVSANGIADPNNVAIGTHLTIPSAGRRTTTSTPPATRRRSSRRVTR